MILNKYIIYLTLIFDYFQLVHLNQKINYHYYHKSYLSANTTLPIKLNYNFLIIQKWFKLNNKKFKAIYYLLPSLAMLHLSLYFKLLFNIFFFCKFLNLLAIIKKYSFVLKRKYKKFRFPRKLQIIYPYDIYNLFFSALMYKDLFLIRNWIKKNIEKRSIKVYKPLIYKIWSLLLTFGWRLRRFNKLCGLFLEFKGKLIKGGSRKKIMQFKVGKLQSSFKSLKFLRTSFYLRTTSGSINCSLYCTFNNWFLKQYLYQT